MIAFRNRMVRGQTRTGWLDSRHTFSFGQYQDSAHMGFRSLLVINEDRVIPGAGFPRHGHSDMEIISSVLEGAVWYKDSLGNGTVIRPGEVQRMSAGTSILHSEFNPSQTEPVHFLQMWIIPNRAGLPPSYEQKAFPVDERQSRLRLVAGPDGRDSTITVHQDACLFVANLEANERVVHEIERGRGLWLQLARGIVTVNGTEMREGDGAAVEDEPAIAIEADTDSEFLLFDLG